MLGLKWPLIIADGNKSFGISQDQGLKGIKLQGKLFGIYKQGTATEWDP